MGQMSLAEEDAAAAAAANPIRKVVNMLQMMQKKISEEADKEKDLYDRFMCFCRSGKGDLAESISVASAKSPAITADIKGSEAQHAQLQIDLKQHQVDRDSAKTTMNEATALREKEKAAFDKEKSELDANLAALAKAISAVEKGMTGGFLQTGAAQTLRNLMMSKQEILDVDREEILAFLSGGSSSQYAPRSGEITGILKEIKDDMSKNLADLTAAEDTAVQDFQALMEAKQKEVGALGESIEGKTERIGTVAVEIVQMKADLSDTQQQLLEDQDILANMEKDCSTKEEEWAVREKTRTDELLALSETIKILNDDDALDLFKKTLPSASASFVQLRAAALEPRGKALRLIQKAKQQFGAGRPELDFLTLALNGRKVGFDKVVKMIDGMVGTLQQEHRDDEHKKEYCGKQMDLADDKKKGHEFALKDAESAIADSEQGVAQAGEDIAALVASIEALDKEVAKQTELRKEEHAETSELIASNTAAKELLGMAKTRLNRFYNPALVPANKTEANATAAEVGAADDALALVQATAVRHRGARRQAPVAPATYGAYQTRGQESSGVIAMIDRLVKDLDEEMTEARTEEEHAQRAYTDMMRDSAERRATDTKSLTQRQATKAALEEDLEGHREKKKGHGQDLMATSKYIESLHAECDWLLQYFDVRKEARDGEIASLHDAKAVLNGADFALLQQAALGRGAR